MGSVNKSNRGRWSEISFEGLGSFEGRRPRWNDIPTAMAFQSRMIDCERFTLKESPATIFPSWNDVFFSFFFLRKLPPDGRGPGVGILGLGMESWNEKGLWLQNHVSKTIQAAQKNRLVSCWLFVFDRSIIALGETARGLRLKKTNWQALWTRCSKLQ